MGKKKKDLPGPVASFIEHLPDRQKALQEALDKDDYFIVKRYAHQLKAAVLFGYPALGDAADKLDKAADKEDAKLCKTLGAEVISAVGDIVDGKVEWDDSDF